VKLPGFKPAGGAKVMPAFSDKLLWIAPRMCQSMAYRQGREMAMCRRWPKADPTPLPLQVAPSQFLDPVHQTIQPPLHTHLVPPAQREPVQPLVPNVAETGSNVPMRWR
jgi:hypothetical protein